MEMGRLTWDGTAGPVSQDQILRRERGQGNINFPCSADDGRPGSSVGTVTSKPSSDVGREFESRCSHTN